MIPFYGGLYDQIAISPYLKEISLIKTIKYNCQSLHLINNRCCVGNLRLFWWENRAISYTKKEGMPRNIPNKSISVFGKS